MPNPDLISIINRRNTISTTHSIKSYRVLARQYRPQKFEDLIGQEAIVKTIENAFRTGRIAHAFMLTGVRGVGKTTLARLLARALNYQISDKQEKPGFIFDQLGMHCKAIMNSNHIDVLEMDAASRTGVNDIREILDSIQYAPVTARYKVYIIDEVHMLSISAFNALLKTLEEPPEHVKFIFATTEVRKIPVTVLSRCQRFDLKRIETPVLADYLSRIAEKEGIKIEKSALTLIARAADGSVRDGLSLLDQAFVQTISSEMISALMIEEMLGFADNVQLAILLEQAANIEQASQMIKKLSEFYKNGADPELVLKDLLSLCHYTTKLKALKEISFYDYGKEVHDILAKLALQLSMAQLTHIWQVLMKTQQQIRFAPNAMHALEMALLQIGIALSLPPPEKIKTLLNQHSQKSESAEINGEVGIKPSTISENKTSSQFKEQSEETSMFSDKEKPDPKLFIQGNPSTDQTLHQNELNQNNKKEIQPSEKQQDTLDPSQSSNQLSQSQQFSTFSKIIEYAETCREISLKSDLERFVRPVHVSKGKLGFSLEKGAPSCLVQTLSQKLQEWTGYPWLVTIETEKLGEQTFYQKKKQKKEQKIQMVKQNVLIKKAFELFEACNIISINQMKTDHPSDNQTEKNVSKTSVKGL